MTNVWSSFRLRGRIRDPHLWLSNLTPGTVTNVQQADYDSRPWSYLAPFLRHGNTLAENCKFFLPTLIICCPGAPLVRCQVYCEETGVMGLSSSEDCMIAKHESFWHSDRQTDGQTDGHSFHNYYVATDNAGVENMATADNNGWKTCSYFSLRRTIS